jgi:hypothetical protein
MNGVLDYTEEPIVSKDIVGNSHSATVDGLSTLVVGGKGTALLAGCWRYLSILAGEYGHLQYRPGAESV